MKATKSSDFQPQNKLVMGVKRTVWGIRSTAMSIFVQGQTLTRLAVVIILKQIEIWNHKVTLQERTERCWSMIPQNQPINQPNSQKVIRFVVTRGGGRRKGYWMKTVRRYKLPGVNIKVLCKYDEYK